MSINSLSKYREAACKAALFSTLVAGDKLYYYKMFDALEKRAEMIKREGSEEDRRRELADLLRTRRERLAPEQFGLPVRGRRRTPGLRREDVAELIDVSATWYTWLEQGRAIHVSTEVVENLARVLHLNSDERTHLFQLAQQPLPSHPPAFSGTVRPVFRRSLSAVSRHLHGLSRNL